MVIIPPQNNFLDRGALIPEKEELEAITHALTNEHDRIVRADGNQYGKLSIKKLEELIVQLEQFAKYNKGSQLPFLFFKNRLN